MDNHTPFARTQLSAQSNKLLATSRRVNRLRNIFIATSLFIAGAVFTQNSQAIQVQIRVVDPVQFKPVSNASVCLGTPAQLDQFGSQRTDSRGLVSFNLATRIPALVTVSGHQRKGVQRAVSVGNTNILREITLPRGGMGPNCEASPSLLPITPHKRQETPKLRLAGLQLDRGEAQTRSRSVILSPTIHGNATHFRVSEDRNFKDAEWELFQAAPMYMLSEGNGLKQLYYQAREVMQVEKGKVERLSNVVSDRIEFISR